MLNLYIEVQLYFWWYAFKVALPLDPNFLSQACCIWFLTEVESRTQGSRPRPRTQKKSEAKAKAKDSPSEDRTSRGQGQECSSPRPRTQAQVFSKKKVFKNFFQAISNSLAYPEFIGISLNHKSNEMTSSKFFQRGSFCGINLS